MRRLALVLLCFALGLAAAALAGGFAGALHPAGDSLGVFRLQLAAAAVALALLLAWLTGSRLALGIAVGAGLLAAPAALSYLPGRSAAPAAAGVVYQKNLNYRTADLAAIASDIRASGADIVLLQEVSARNRPILDMLGADYPSRAFCPFGRIGGTVVLSRWPAEGPPRCAEGLTALRLAASEGPVWAVSVHLHWPWPFGQAAQVERLLPVLAELDAPAVVGGDFNMVPWGATVRRIEAAAGARKAGPTVTTLSLEGGLVPLAIDHVLLPASWSVSQAVRPEFGSDHRGVLVRFAGDALTPGPDGS